VASNIGYVLAHVFPLAAPVFFRRIVQDRERPHWREETPATPEEEIAGARAAH
jgi:hypothetical protein